MNNDKNECETTYLLISQILQKSFELKQHKKECIGA